MFVCKDKIEFISIFIIIIIFQPESLGWGQAGQAGSSLPAWLLKMCF